MRDIHQANQAVIKLLTSLKINTVFNQYNLKQYDKVAMHYANVKQAIHDLNQQLVKLNNNSSLAMLNKWVNQYYEILVGMVDEVWEVNNLVFRRQSQTELNAILHLLNVEIVNQLAQQPNHSVKELVSDINQINDAVENSFHQSKPKL